MTKKESKNKGWGIMKKKPIELQTKDEAVLEADKIVDETNDELEQEIFDFPDMCYTTFLLFYKYLKTAKIGRQFNGWWITNHFIIEQRWDDYKIIVWEIEYKITKESCTDITEFIKLYL